MLTSARRSSFWLARPASNSAIRFWVKKNFVALPFIYKKLPSVEMSGTDAAPGKRAHRRTDDREDTPPPTKKLSKAQTKQTELLK